MDGNLVKLWKFARRRARKENYMTIPTMITIKECADRTGLSYDFIRKLCLQDKIVYIKTGKKFLINLEKLVQYLNGEEAEAGE